MAKPVAGLVQQLAAMEPKVDESYRALEDLKQVCEDMRVAKKAMDRQMQLLEGYKNDLLKLEANAKAENQAFKRKQEDLASDQQDFKQSLQKQEREMKAHQDMMQKQMAAYEARVNDRLNDASNAAERLSVQAQAHTNAKFEECKARLADLHNLFLELGGSQKDQISKVNDFAEVLELNRRNVELMERRMDHMATALKELRVEFGF